MNLRISRSTRTLMQAVASIALASCGAGSESPAATTQSTSAGAAPVAPVVPASGVVPVGATSFETRCAQPGVIKCVGFDDPSEFNTGAGGTNGAYGMNSGLFPPSGTSNYALATRDTTVKASGSSSLKFTIPPNSGSDTSGSYFTNFSSDLSLQFGENSDFFIQWRQRFSPEFINTRFAGSGGWKQIIIGTGDQPSQWYASCTALEIVVHNNYQRGFAQLYDSCDGSASHGPYDPFEEFVPPYDFKLQNGRPAPYCLYSQSSASYFPPTGNCFGYVANEWMTFQVEIQTGPRVGNEFVNSHVMMWIGREGKPSELVMDWGPYNLSAGIATQDQKFGKVWLLPYQTGKDPSVSYPTAYTWYDDLIISRNKITDP